MRKSWFVTLDLRDSPCVCHDTFAELSLQNPVCIPLVGTTPSNTRHTKTSAAISRSDFAMLPVGFAKVASLRRNLYGHYILHTIGAKAFVLGIHTPPAPSTGASRVAL